MDHLDRIRQQFDQLTHYPKGVGTVTATGSVEGGTGAIKASQAQLTLIQTIMEIPADIFEDMANTENMNTVIESIRFAFSDEVIHEVCAFSPTVEDIIMVVKQRFSTRIDVFTAERILSQHINVEEIQQAAIISRVKTQQHYRARAALYAQIKPHWGSIQAVLEHEKQA